MDQVEFVAKAMCREYTRRILRQNFRTKRGPVSLTEAQLDEIARVKWQEHDEEARAAIEAVDGWRARNGA